MVFRSTPFRVIRLAAGPRDPQDGDPGAQGGDRKAQEDRRAFHDVDEAPGHLAELGLDHMEECEDHPDRGGDEPSQKDATFPAHTHRFAATAFFTAVARQSSPRGGDDYRFSWSEGRARSAGRYPLLFTSRGSSPTRRWRAAAALPTAPASWPCRTG